MEPDIILEALVSSYRFIIPEMVLGLSACVLFLLGTFRADRHLAAGVALIAMIVAVMAHFFTAGYQFTDLGPDVAAAATFNGPLSPDALARLVRVIALGGGIILVLFSWDEVADR